MAAPKKLDGFRDLEPLMALWAKAPMVFPAMPQNGAINLRQRLQYVRATLLGACAAGPKAEWPTQWNEAKQAEMIALGERIRMLQVHTEKLPQEQAQLSIVRPAWLDMLEIGLSEAEGKAAAAASFERLKAMQASIRPQGKAWAIIEDETTSAPDYPQTTLKGRGS